MKDFEEDYSAKDFSRPIFTKLIEYATLNKNKMGDPQSYQKAINKWTNSKVYGCLTKHDII